MVMEEYKMSKATKVEEMIQSFTPFPLGDKNFQDFYVDTRSARANTDTVGELSTLLRYSSSNAKILFTGYMGSGKTTELYRLTQTIADDFIPITIRLEQELDAYSLTHVDLALAIMNAVVNYANTLENVKNEAIVDNLYNYWNTDKTLLQTTGLEETLDLAGGFKAEASAKLNFLNKMKFLMGISSSLTGILKTGTETKTEIRQKMDPRLSVFLQMLNDVIYNINIEIAPKKLLLIIEDSDKLDIAKANEIFIEHRKALLALNIPTIIMLPIYMVFSSNFAALSGAVDSVVMLDMIQLYNEDGSLNSNGVQILTEIVEKRADKTLFEDEVLGFLIEKSGGLLRDLFKMITKAAVGTIVANKTKVDMETAKNAYQSLKIERKRVIRNQEYVDVLLAIYNDPTSTLDNEILLELLRSTVVIQFPNSSRYMLHPVIVDYLKESGRL